MSELDKILKSQERTHASLEKRTPSRPQPLGGELFLELATSLKHIHQQLSGVPAATRSRAEIEVRVGLISHLDQLTRATSSIPGSGALQIEAEVFRSRKLHFVSGVSAPTFCVIKDELARQYRTHELATSESVYVYDSGNLRDERVVTKDGRPPYRERKEPKSRKNFQLPAADYDLRLQASIEHASEPLVGSDGRPTAVPGEWSKKRHKQRASFKSPTGAREEEAWLWQADLTLVEETTQDVTGLHARMVREVELELIPQARDLWLNLTDPQEIIAMTSKIATHLLHLLETINPMEPISSVSNPVLEQDMSAKGAAVAACTQLRGGWQGRGSSFPGAQPVNMCKRNVADVQRGSYFVAEKTDGVRYLMVVVSGLAGGTCVLVDRSMNVFQVAGGAFLAELLGVGTVLDGELVHNRGMKKTVFVLFDILRNQQEVLTGQIFKERFKVLHAVMKPYHSHIKGAGNKAQGHLMLIMKTFYRRREIMDLFRNVRTEGRDRVFKDGPLRHHKTDGIIFQPNTPYTMGTDPRLLKWKWADLASVDLRVYPPGVAGESGGRSSASNSEVRFCSDAGDRNEVDLSAVVHLSEYDQARLLGDMRGKHVIAEVALDPDSGLWTYMGLRPDKDRPNFIRTVISTMVEVAEGLSEEELKYRMLSETPASDDWARQESTMRKRAVQWQYKKCVQRQAAAEGSGPQPPPGGSGNGMAHGDRRESSMNGKGDA